MYVYEYLGIIKDMRDKKDEGPQNFLGLKWFTGLELRILNRKSSTTHTENQKKQRSAKILCLLLLLNVPLITIILRHFCILIIISIMNRQLAVVINLYCMEYKFLFYIISYERDVAIYMKPYHAYISVQYY